MNTTLSRPTARPTTHPPQSASIATPPRRLGMLDRLALHLGIALVRWSRRPARAAARSEYRAAAAAEALDRHCEVERLRTEVLRRRDAGRGYGMQPPLR